MWEYHEIWYIYSLFNKNTSKKIQKNSHYKHLLLNRLRFRKILVKGIFSITKYTIYKHIIDATTKPSINLLKKMRIFLRALIFCVCNFFAIYLSPRQFPLNHLLIFLHISFFCLILSFSWIAISVVLFSGTLTFFSYVIP